MSKKEPTIYDLAEHLNVSGSTISRALSNHHSISKKTRKKVVELAKEMGYRKNSFASQLRNKKTYNIGVIIHELNSDFITSVLNGIGKVATEARYNIIIGHSSESSTKEIAIADNLLYQRVDGLITSLAYDTVNLSHYDPFIERGVPIVFIDRVPVDALGVKVVIDNKAAGYNATKHLIEQGCERIMHITADLSKNVYSDRFEGFKKALMGHNMVFEPEQLLITNLSEKAGVKIAQQILNMERKPDGLFITNDLCASVCMYHLKKNGIKVPEDIAIVGFNNDIISRIVDPKLTTVNYEGEEIGKVAATNLINQLSDNPSNSSYTIVLDSDLLIRESSQIKQHDILNDTINKS
ncbi:LacI family DNA-binding transcriptional regulator [Galbibacter sp. EGI 63066]|uniref:LacI family DNA-binding transcriptional regulator n=1 Tax=Galbibacter sp. EGI 63066 TaxID=2993559 RepID=UPI0022493806|nr:LacI family DNA-binding transcriptional regulator [Galbibacter sp. EGI 63066]MCX2678654.1 LacI family DNA-binding transcriptional regulator [Galbibacter sp. EGI 63066]